MYRPSRLAVFLLAAASSVAQNPAKPVALYSGLGTWRHTIATRSPEAQKYFDQGLALVYGFNREEGLRSFRKAAELDPEAPMTWWGIGYAFAPYINMDGDPTVSLKESCAAVEKGLTIHSVNPVERDWLKAAESRCPDFARPERYIEAARLLALRYPDDPDAQVLYAEALMIPTRWHWYDAEGKASPGVEEAELILEGVLRAHSGHPGANHLYIHAVESSPAPERAIPSAERLMGIMPAAGHIVHMPGHIWLALGEFEQAVDVNRRAADVDRKYFAQTGMTGSYYMYYLHNLDFIVYARQMQGRFADTRKAVLELQQAAAPLGRAMPEMAGAFDSVAIMADLRFCRWDDLLAAAKPRVPDPASLSLWRYARALALAVTGRNAEARTERTEFEKARQTIDEKAPFGENRAADVMALAAIVLDARLARSPAAATELWKRAVSLQDHLVYDEPPPWYYPVRESLGAALLRAGNAAAAEEIFREGLRRGPHNGRMIFGLLESLKVQKKKDAVPWVKRDLETAWKGADVELRLSDL